MRDGLGPIWGWAQAGGYFGEGPELHSQNFTADLTVKRANGGIRQLTIGNLYGKVDVICLTPASKDFELKSYKKLDVIELRLRVAMGCKALVRLETEDGKVANFELLGLRKENKKVKMTVKAINGGDMQIGLLKKVNMSIEVIGASWLWQMPPLLESETRYESKTKTVTFRNDLNGRQRPPHPIFGFAMQTGVPLQLDLWRNGFKTRVVANVESIKADSEGFEVKLNNKDLTGNGRAAIEAATGLILLKSGTYALSINRIPIFGGYTGTLSAADYVPDYVIGFSAADFGYAGYGPGRDAAGAISAADYGRVPATFLLDVKGELKKTKDLGVLKIKFALEKGSRILYRDSGDDDDDDDADDDDDDEKAKMTEIKSMSSRKFLRRFSERLKEYYDNDAGTAGYPFVRVRLEDGKDVTGEIGILKDNNGEWSGYINIAFNDAEGLKNTTSVGTFSFCNRTCWDNHRRIEAERMRR
jgi:hypothetical protein